MIGVVVIATVSVLAYKAYKKFKNKTGKNLKQYFYQLLVLRFVFKPLFIIFESCNESFEIGLFSHIEQFEENKNILLKYIEVNTTCVM